MKILPIILAAIVFSTASFSSAEVASSEREQQLISEGYQLWHWQTAECVGCETELVGLTPELQSADVQKFMATLGQRKAEVIELYADKITVTSDEYNLLAQMAVGILGRESKFFASPRYVFKEQFPWAVHLVKYAEVYFEGGPRGPSPNSRGPTQIKVVPSKIAKRYAIAPENLYIAENAALATIGFLIESLDELKRRAVIEQLPEVQPGTYVDYLPYIYFGSIKSLLNHKADPEHNSYVIEMKKYMSWVDILEKSSGDIQLR